MWAGSERGHCGPENQRATAAGPCSTGRAGVRYRGRRAIRSQVLLLRRAGGPRLPRAYRLLRACAALTAPRMLDPWSFAGALPRRIAVAIYPLHVPPGARRGQGRVARSRCGRARDPDGGRCPHVQVSSDRLDSPASRYIWRMSTALRSTVRSAVAAAVGVVTFVFVVPRLTTVALPSRHPVDCRRGASSNRRSPLPAWRVGTSSSCRRWHLHHRDPRTGSPCWPSWHGDRHQPVVCRARRRAETLARRGIRAALRLGRALLWDGGRHGDRRV